MRRTLATVLCLCTWPVVSSAHGFVLYVSTPITPPRELVWWLPISLGLLVAGAFLILWQVLGRHWLASAGLALAAIAVFAVPFFMLGRFVESLSTAPLPGLGLPNRTFWGMGWCRVGWLFVRWNLYGYGFLLASLFVCGGVRRTTHLFARLAIFALLLYMLGIMPYLTTGALVSGWGGGHVRMACDGRLEVLSSALLDYAAKHEGKLPTADGMNVLLNELQPFVSQERARHYASIDVCPLGGAYERDPKHYVWNTNFSGASLHDIDLDRFSDGVVPITCPYHVNWGGRGWSVFEEEVIRARQEKGLNQAQENAARR